MVIIIIIILTIISIIGSTITTLLLLLLLLPWLSLLLLLLLLLLPLLFLLLLFSCWSLAENYDSVPGVQRKSITRVMCKPRPEARQGDHFSREPRRRLTALMFRARKWGTCLKAAVIPAGCCGLGSAAAERAPGLTWVHSRCQRGKRQCLRGRSPASLSLHSSSLSPAPRLPDVLGGFLPRELGAGWAGQGG